MLAWDLNEKKSTGDSFIASQNSLNLAMYAYTVWHNFWDRLVTGSGIAFVIANILKGETVIFEYRI